MADEITIVVNAEDNFSGVLGNFGNIMTGIKSTIDLVSGAIQAGAEFIGQFVDSASESEQAVARLEGVLRATGGAAGMTSEELQNTANAFQEVTRFSDETILNGASLLLTFRNISGETFERTIPSMLDMAEIFGSVDSAAMQLGKALNDPLTGMGALSRAGITFSDEQKEMIKNFMEMGDIASAQNIILSEVEAQVSGLAETMGNTFSGKVEIFKNTLDTVKETIGGALLPILGEFLGMFQEGLPILQDFANMLATAISTGDFTPLIDKIKNTFSGINWSEIFQSIADSVAAVDWSALGESLTNGINSIDWGKVGNIVAEGLGQLAIIIGTVLDEIDWISLYGAIFSGLIDFISGLFGFIDWNDMISSAKIGFQYVGQAIVDGIKFGIQATWNSLSTYFMTNWSDFVRLVKNFLGISSPSSVFINIAKDIVQGLIDGFKLYWGNIVTLAQESLDDFLNIFGIDLFSSSGSTGGGPSTHPMPGGNGGTGGTTTSGEVHNYYYGPVYFMGGSEPGSYECTPNPILTAGSQTVMPNGVH